MAKIIHTARAIEDLARLVEFLEKEVPESASEMVVAILDALTLLGAHPLLGRRVERNYRELVISRGKAGYLATYHFDPVREEVRVLRIRHQREAGYQD